MQHEFINGLIAGLLIGMLLGIWFYSKVLDKPEVQNNYNSKIKQKRGIFNNIFRRNKNEDLSNS